MGSHSQERTNAARYGLGEGIWGLGSGLVSVLTVLPLVLRRLGATPIELGILFAMANGGILLTQVLGTYLFQHGRGKKRFLVRCHLFIVLPYCAATGAIIYLLSGSHPALARALILSVFSLHVLCLGAIVPIWFDWVAELFRMEARGRAMGMGAAAFAIGATVGAGAAGLIRHVAPFPAGFALLFVVCLPLFALSLLAFGSVVEDPEHHVPVPRASAKELKDRLLHSLADQNFRNYLTARIMMMTGVGAWAFFAVHFRSPSGGQVSGALIISFDGLRSISQAVCGYLLGRIGDRSGHKFGIVLGQSAYMLAVAVAVVSKGAVACAVCFALLGVAFSADLVSHSNMIYETCPHDNRTVHITLSNVATCPFLIVAPLLTGVLVVHWGMVVGMAVCLIPTALGVMWTLFRVKDPRAITLVQRP